MEGIIGFGGAFPRQRVGCHSKGRGRIGCGRLGGIPVTGDAVRTRRLTHVDSEGRSRMVDVTAKDATHRVARAEAFVKMAPATLKLLRANALPKGNPLETARIAGIQAAKKTSDLIPLCHPLPLTHVDVSIALARGGVRLESTASTKAETGVEMEALAAAAIAALTLYDMCKAVEKGISIEKVRLLEKTGGKSGRWVRK